MVRPACRRPGTSHTSVVEHRQSLLAEPRSYRWQGLRAKDTETTASPSPTGGSADDRRLSGSGPRRPQATHAGTGEGAPTAPAVGRRLRLLDPQPGAPRSCHLAWPTSSIAVAAVRKGVPAALPSARVQPAMRPARSPRRPAPTILQPVLAGVSILLADGLNAGNGLYVKPRNAAACGHALAGSATPEVTEWPDLARMPGDVGGNASACSSPGFGGQGQREYEEQNILGRLRRRGAAPHRSTAVTSPADARARAEAPGPSSAAAPNGAAGRSPKRSARPGGTPSGDGVPAALSGPSCASGQHRPAPPACGAAAPPPGHPARRQAAANPG